MNIFTFTKLMRALLLSAVLAVSAVCWVGCFVEDNGGGGGNDGGGGGGGGGSNSTTYLVTVTSEGAGASRGGYYPAGATVDISAGTGPSGYIFDKWTTSSNGVFFADPSSATTSFTMPANAASVTALFKQDVNDPPSEGNGTLIYAGQTYRTIRIGNQLWMAENLNYATSTGKSWCSNCAKFGRLYDWEAAVAACPAGWHLPYRGEWGELAVFAGGKGTYGDEGTAGKKLKATSMWGTTSPGTDDYGFTALPGGYYSGSSSSGVGTNGYWWTATEYNSEQSYFRYMYYDDDRAYESFHGVGKSYGLSVRCVKDN